MKKIGLSVFIYSSLLVLFSCSSKQEDVVYIPIFSSSQKCVNEYLNKINYFKDAENIELKQLPFKVDAPSPIVGLLEIKPDRSREMQAIYNGLKYGCYPNLRKRTTLIASDWNVLADDIAEISKNKEISIDAKKPIYLKVDITNKVYELYQDGSYIEK